MSLAGSNTNTHCPGCYMGFPFEKCGSLHLGKLTGHAPGAALVDEECCSVRQLLCQHVQTIILRNSNFRHEALGFTGGSWRYTCMGAP